MTKESEEHCTVFAEYETKKEGKFLRLENLKGGCKDVRSCDLQGKMEGEAVTT
jgi:hypothetical protein